MSITNSILPAAGLHLNVPFEIYQSWDAANFSTIKPISETASKCKYEMDNPRKQTAAMVLGSALHIATLEPGRFEDMFHICPPCDGRTKEGKETLAQEMQKAGKKLFIRSGLKDDENSLGEFQNLRGMANSLRASKTASAYLDAPGFCEVSALWKDEPTGLWCKARWDKYLPKFRGVADVIVEIKSARDGSEWGFGGEINSRKYGAQAAGYRHAHEVLTGRKAFHVFIVAEKLPPFDTQCFFLGDTSLQTGYLQYRQMLTRFAECKKTNSWPGYPDKLTEIQMPNWANEKTYEN